MGKKTFGRKLIWRLHIPEEIALRIELDCFDPITGKPDYGARSQLITMLLTKYLSERQSLESAGQDGT